MKKGEAVNLLMKEYGAGEEFRPFFTKIVSDYMGDAGSVLRSDLENLRELLKEMR